MQPILNTILVKLNLIPKPLLDVTEPVVRARTIIAATHLGVFAQLGQKSMTCEQLASGCGADARALQYVLKSLVGWGYLKEKDNIYSNSSMVRKFLLEDSPSYIGNMIGYQDLADEMTKDLYSVVKTGKPSRNFDEYLADNPEQWEKYVLGMRDTATLATAEVAQKVEVPPGAKTLLDLGGSHGVHAMSICRRNPQLRAVVFDRPECVAVGNQIAEQAGMTERITYLAGDFWHDQFGNNFDIVLLFAILHLHNAEKNLALLRKVNQAMAPGGMLVIADFLKDRLSEAWIAQFSLGMLCFFGEGQAYSQQTIREWLDHAGFVNVAIKNLRNPASLIISYKPS